MLLLTAMILAETTTRLRPRLRALIGVGLLVTRLRPAALPIEAQPLHIDHNRVSGANLKTPRWARRSPTSVHVVSRAVGH